MTNIENTARNVLVMGASGRSGLEILRVLSAHDSKPQIHAFCRNPDSLNASATSLCTSVVRGNAKSVADIERALRETKADVVVVSLGNGDSVRKSDIRTASAEALVIVMKKPEFLDVHAVIVSSAGAGKSKIKVGMGIGMMISYHLRHVLADHTGQERAFMSSPGIQMRTCIVRATSLVDNKATGKIATYGDKEKAPTIETDRADLATWITKQVCQSTSCGGGQIVNITGSKI